MDRKSSPDSFIDPTTAGFAFDPVSGLDLLQYPAEPYGMPSLHSSSPRLGYGLNLVGTMSEYTYSGAPSYTASPSARPFTPPQSASIFPGALSNLSPGEMSSDSMQSGRTSRGSSTHSPSLSAIPRAHRFNPLAVAPSASRGPTTRRRRGSTKQTDDFSDDDDDFPPAASTGPDVAVNRREEVRRQRIESEQRRRDELRDGYRRLKEVLPVSNQKSSKVALLDRATTHIKCLETTQHELQVRLQRAETETARLRQLNETLMLTSAEQRHALATAMQQQHPTAGAF
ncbi:hypothetical protein K488DRAFT_58236 [Vararia minispora EC-137]|uniref:Uncharacterized protein n=1 Tax=Vararia minispora EC-137 TaxID=1314806 RepID=A0ACB8QAK0_9AGAM|nr:hypothetical protein K488DRAFT_58236 [Vararia minispora EC-137]